MKKALMQGMAMILSGIVLFSQAGIVYAVETVSQNELDENEVGFDSAGEGNQAGVSANSMDEDSSVEDKDSVLAQNVAFIYDSIEAVNVDKVAGTFDVFLKGLNPLDEVENVVVLVWTETDQGDLRAHYPNIDGDGNYSVKIPASDYGGKESEYFIEVYVVDHSMQEYYLDSLRCDLTREKTVFTYDTFEVVEADLMAGTMELCLEDLDPMEQIETVQFRAWTKNDKSDMKIYTAKLDAEGNFTAILSASQHGKAAGTYYIEAYLIDILKHEYSLATIQYDLTPSFTTTVKGHIYGESRNVYRIEARDLENAYRVKFKMWYGKDGEKKAKTYKAQKDKNGIWYYDIPIKKMSKEGAYKINVFAQAAYGAEKKVTTKSVVYERQIKMTVKAVSKKQKKFRIAVTGAFDASRVRFEVWSQNSGQKKMKQYKAKRGKNDVWSYDVPIKNHKQDGKYFVKAYMKVGKKEKYIGKKIFHVSGPSNADGKVKNNNGKQSQFDLVISNLTSPSGMKEVKVKAYSKSKKSKAKWFRTVKQTDGTYKATINVNPKYYFDKQIVEVYAKDNNGIQKQVWKKSVTMKKPSVGVGVTESADRLTHTIKATGVPFAEAVKMQVWTTIDGKDDLKTYKAKRNSDEVWYAKVPVSNHKDEGKCKVVVQAQIGGKTIKVGTGSFIMQSKYPIMGTTETTVSQMVGYYNANAAYPEFYQTTDAVDIQAFCQMYVEECNAEGVKAEVAFAQAMKETNFLRYGGEIQVGQFNFASLGVSETNKKGNSFSTVRIGIRAQVQQLKAYASNTAPYVEWLGKQENPKKTGWSTEAKYGINIVKMIMNLKTY